MTVGNTRFDSAYVNTLSTTLWRVFIPTKIMGIPLIINPHFFVINVLNILYVVLSCFRPLRC